MGCLAMIRRCWATIQCMLECVFPNMRRYAGERSGQSSSLPTPKEAEHTFQKWHYRVGFEFPGIYKDCLDQGNYLAAFLVVCNLIEFHLMQYLFKFSFGKADEHARRLMEETARRLRFLPDRFLEPVMKFVVRLGEKLERCPQRVVHTPGYYAQNDYTLGRLIAEANKKGVDKGLVKQLNKFNGRRKMLVHSMLDLDHVDRNIEVECRKACEAAEKVWELLRASYLGVK